MVCSGFGCGVGFFVAEREDCVSPFNLSLATFLLGMMGLERSPVGCGVATAFLWLWRAASSFGTGNPYGVVGVRLLFVGAKVSSGGGFTSEVRRGLVCRRDDGT